MNLIGRICPLLVCPILCSMLVAQQAPGPTPPAPPPAPPPAQPAAQTQAAPVQEPDNIDRMFSIGVFDWMASGGPSLHAGTQAIVPPSHDLTLPQKPRQAYGAMITIPMKGSSRLDLSYMKVYDRGGALAPTDVGLFGGIIPQNEPLDMDYTLRHFKLSYNYLSYPNPPQDAKFRIKTLWEFHYLQIEPTVVATVSAPFQPLTAKQSIKLPAVGLGMEYVASKHFRLELRGSGMAFPHRSSIGDAEASAVLRLGGLEIFGGGKFLHFKTSPKNETFVSGTLWGPDVGVRWVFR